MSIMVYTSEIQISKRELGLTRDRFTQSVLRQAIETKIQWSAGRTVANPPDLDAEIANFAERLAAGATRNVSTYFARLGTAGYTKGGRRATSQPLLYLKDRLLPSAEDIGSIGEGLAGYYLESIEGMNFVLRPFGVSPDFVFWHPALSREILVEAKSSLHQGRISITTAISLIEIMAKTKFIRPGNYGGFVIQVNIIGPADFELY